MWEAFVLNPSKWWDSRGYKIVADFENIKLSATEVLLFTKENQWTEAAFYHSGSVKEDDKDEPQRVIGYEFGPEVATRSLPSAAGQLSEAVKELGVLVQRGCHLDDNVFYGILRRCIAHKDLALGSRVHVLAVRNGHGSNAFLANHVMCMYASHGRLEQAMEVFLSMAEPNRHIWSSIIQAHTRHGQAAKAIELYHRMRQSTEGPDNHIFVAVLKACASARDLSAGREVHADILESNGRPDMFVFNCLIDMYAKCGSLEQARKVFDRLPVKDVVTWTSMVAGYVLHGRCHEALALFASMKQEGITPANHVTFVSLLQACASVGALDVGKQLHSEIEVTPSMD